MKEWIDILIVSILLADLIFLASSRLSACIRIVAFQGLVIGILPLMNCSHGVMARTLILVFGTITLKGLVFPWLLFKALREANVRREVEPILGYSLSISAGILAVAVSFWLSFRLPMPATPVASALILPVALSTIIIGLFVIVTRVKALNQVLGYLMLENGIYVFGFAFLLEQPVLVELGILLDIFVAVFVMGITIFHISREFDHIDTDALAKLTDLGE